MLDSKPSATRKPLTSAQTRLVALIAALTVGSLVYRIVVRHHLEQTAVLFIGLPAILAILLALAPPARSLTGGILRGISLALLLCGPLLGEGFICVLMAAPLFLLVGLGVGLIVDHLGRARKGVTLGCCALVLLPMSLEGINPALSFGREGRVVASAVVEGTVAEVRARLAQSLKVETPLPLYLRLGFPHPRWAVGEGLRPGDLRRVHFEGGEGAPGDMIFQVVASGSDWARFALVSDGCAGMHGVGHWVGIQEATIRWSPDLPGRTRVTWELSYQRRLDPAWYFGPWERYGVGLAARYLIDANAGPR